MNFVSDVKELRPLIIKKAWNNVFMEELQARIIDIPFTVSTYLLNKTYRSSAGKVVEVLKLILKENYFYACAL